MEVPPPPSPFRTRFAYRSAQISLVLLRLAIGWHLFIQGLDKIESVARGPTNSSQPWSSRGYLLEAQGPLEHQFRKLAGDPQSTALEFLRVPPRRTPVDPRYSLPVRVEELWDQYHKKFLSHFEVKKAHQGMFEQLLKNHKQAFLQRPLSTERSYPAGNVIVPLTLAQQIEEYTLKSREYDELRKETLGRFGGGVHPAKLAELKADVARTRDEVLRLVATASENLQLAYEAHRQLLTQPFRLGDVAASHAQPFGQTGPLLWTIQLALSGFLSPERKPMDGPSLVDAIPIVTPSGPLLPLADFVMRWGLLLAGAGLLLGLATRPACVAGALLLLLIFLAQPPLPGLPAGQNLPGYTPFVNQTLIEVLALLVLATFPTGRWLGLDALVKLLVARRKVPASGPASEPTLSASPPQKMGTGKHRRYTGS